MIRNWIREQINKFHNWCENYTEQLSNDCINNIRYVIANTYKTKDAFTVLTLWLIKGDLNNIAKLQGLSKYKAFQYVFDRLGLEMTESEIQEYKVALKDWFNS